MKIGEPVFIDDPVELPRGRYFGTIHKVIWEKDLKNNLIEILHVDLEPKNGIGGGLMISPAYRFRRWAA